jgi:hypothetical protein
LGIKGLAYIVLPKSFFVKKKGEEDMKGKERKGKERRKKRCQNYANFQNKQSM